MLAEPIFVPMVSAHENKRYKIHQLGLLQKYWGSGSGSAQLGYQTVSNFILCQWIPNKQLRKKVYFTCIHSFTCIYHLHITQKDKEKKIQAKLSLY